MKRVQLISALVMFLYAQVPTPPIVAPDAAATPLKTSTSSSAATGPAYADVDSFGAYHTSVSVAVPVFHGLEPSIRLSYSSNSGNGLVGVGWRLDASSYVVRASPARGAPKYDNTDIFFLDGMELVPCAPNSQSPSCTSGGTHSTKIENFQRIRLDATSNVWYVWEKNGTQLIYTSQPSRPDIESSYRWTLSRVQDTHGNTVNYQYWCDLDQECYLDLITYADAPSTSNFDGAAIKFYYEIRQDIITYANGLALAKVRYRLKSIDVRMAGERLRAYALTYTTSATTSRSLLQSVQQYGTDATIDSAGNITGTSLPLISFEMSSSSGGWTPRLEPHQAVSFESRFPEHSSVFNKYGIEYCIQDNVHRSYDGCLIGPFLGDITGDGKDDWFAFRWFLNIELRIESEYTETCTQIGSGMNTGNAYLCMELEFLTFFRDSTGTLKLKNQLLFYNYPVGSTHPLPPLEIFVRDVNGDGKSDIIVKGANFGRSSSGYVWLETYLSQGDGTYSLPIPSYSNSSSQKPPSTCSSGDVNGDAMVDLVCFGQSYSALAKQIVAFRNTAISTGEQFHIRTDYATPHYTLPDAKTLESNQPALGDVNGDGFADLMTFTSRKLIVEISNGDRTFLRPKEYPTTWPEKVHPPNGRFIGWTIADINSDGRSDFVVVLTDAILTARAQPGGQFLLYEKRISALPPETVVSTGDTDGDGRSDLLLAYPHKKHNAIANCMPSVNTTHVNLLRLLSNGDGSFYVPPDLDCDTFHTDFPWLGQTGVSNTKQSADLNGDGLADFLLFYKDCKSISHCPSSHRPNSYIIDDLSVPTGSDRFNWTPTDVNGDGRQDLVYTFYLNPGVRVYTSLRTANGEWDLKTPQSITPTAGLPGLDNPDARRWLAIDVGGPPKSSAGGQITYPPDGKTDLVYVDYANKGIRIYTLFSNGDGTWNPVMDPAWPGFASADAHHWKPMDLNGDGRMDLVYIFQTVDANIKKRVIRIYALLAQGNGKWTQLPPEDHKIDPYAPFITARWMPIDSNGDGKSDVVHILNGHIMSFISKGDGTWTQVIQPISQSKSSSGARNWKPAELNGDGMTDLVQTRSHPSGTNDLVFSVYLSMGNGYWRKQEVPSDDFKGFPESDTLNWRPMDVNRDGRSDLVHISTYMDGNMSKTRITVALNQSDGWRKIITPDPTNVATSDLGMGFVDIWKWRFMDADNDGNPGLIYVAPWGSYFAPAGILPFTLEANWETERLVRLDNGMGATTIITYGTSAGKHAYMPAGAVVQTVASVTTSAGNSSGTTTYDYEGAEWSDVERRFLGFAKITAEDIARTITQYDLSDECGVRTSTTALEDLSGGLFNSRIYHYTKTGVNGNAPWTCLLTGQSNHEYELTSTSRTTSMSVDYDTYGNVVHVFENGLTSDPSDDRATESVYYPNIGDYIVGLPASTTLFSHVNKSGSWQWQEMATTLFEYDSNSTHAAPPSSLGELRRIKKWNDQNGTYVTTEIEYDGKGNVTKVIVPLTKSSTISTSISYDPIHQLFPERTCNAKFCSSQEWDKVLGRVHISTDQNQQRVTYDYDIFGRLTSTTYPDGSNSGLDYINWGMPDSQRVHSWTSDESPSDGVFWSDSYFDGLGRTYKVVTEAGITQEFDFIDPSARLLKESGPYGPGESPVWTTYEYDAAMRVTKVIYPDGNFVRLSYSVGSQSTFDELNHEHALFFDGFGRPVQVREIKTKCPEPSVLTGQLLPQLPQPNWELICELITYDTTYNYDILDRLTQVIDQAGNKTTATWDSLGRKIQSCDPDMGCWNYSYYDNGLLQSRTDAKSQKVEFFYDEIGRTRRKEYLDSLGSVFRKIEWHYDRDPVSGVTQGLSVGHLVLVEDSGSGTSERFWYDVMGRVGSESKCIGTLCYQLNYRFDKAGRLKMITYPDASGQISSDSEDVIYNYDEQGRLVSVPGYVTQFGYNSAGQLTSVLYSNDISAQYEYDSERYWLDSAIVREKGTLDVIYQATYEHDAKARIKSMNVRNSLQDIQVVMNFVYDDLDRLTGLTSSDRSHNRTFEYDPLGNMISNSSVGQYTYGDPLHVHAVTQVGNKTYQYDAIGNMEKNSDYSIAWDYDNMPVTIKNLQTNDSTTFAYAPSGQRIKKTSPDGSTTYYFGPLIERAPDGSLIKYYYAGSMRVARRDSSGLHFYHLDHLGSTRLMTDEGGKVTERYDYEPFGGARGSHSANAIGYAGQREDTEIGLIYMNARYYDPVLARFISADSIVPDPFDPQSLNRYSYVRNNPISRIDPTGHADWGVCKQYPSDGACTGYSAYGSNTGDPGLNYGVSWTDKGFGTQPPGGGSEEWNRNFDPGNSSHHRICDACHDPNYLYTPNIDIGAPYEWAQRIEQSDWYKSITAPRDYGKQYNTVGIAPGEPLIPQLIQGVIVSTKDVLKLGIGAAESTEAEGLDKVVPMLQDVSRFSTGFNTLAGFIRPATIPRTSSPNLSPTAALRSRALEIHSLSDPIAMRNRATTVIRALKRDGTMVDVIASGGRDLTKTQRAALYAPREMFAKFSGLHAEPTALEYIYSQGWKPLYGATAGPQVCP